MTTVFAPLTRMIAARAPRERRLMLVATVVIGLAVIISLAEWTWHARERLARQVPEAQATLAKMQDDAGELLRLNRLPAPPSVPLATLARSAAAAASSRGLELTVEASGDTLRVSGSGPFPALIDWLASVQSDQRLRPQQVVIEVIDGGARLETVLTPGVDH